MAASGCSIPFTRATGTSTAASQTCSAISDESNILAAPEVTPNPAVFGAEPAHTWCYYFEKADLARQLGDWQTVLQLKAQVDAHAFTPGIGAEYFPFIEAYAWTGQWEQAFNLSVTASGIGPGPGVALCNLWQSFQEIPSAAGSNAEQLSFTGKAVQEFCSSTNP